MIKATQPTPERRGEPCISGPFPAVVLNLAGCDNSFGLRTELENLSAGSFYLRLGQLFEEGEKLLVITQVSHAILVLRGVISHIETLPDGMHGLSVSIIQHQIFPHKGQRAQLHTHTPPKAEFQRTQA
jgi:hypothetical protein